MPLTFAGGYSADRKHTWSFRPEGLLVRNGSEPLWWAFLRPTAHVRLEREIGSGCDIRFEFVPGLLVVHPRFEIQLDVGPGLVHELGLLRAHLCERGRPQAMLHPEIEPTLEDLVPVLDDIVSLTDLAGEKLVVHEAVVESRHDVAGIGQTTAQVGLVKVVLELLVESSDGNERLPPK
jgi:hypothetical protein